MRTWPQSKKLRMANSGRSLVLTLARRGIPLLSGPTALIDAKLSDADDVDRD